MVRVMLVEDQRTARLVLEDAIARGKSFEIVVSIEDASLAELYCESNEIDLILMDVYTAQRANGLDAAGKIKERFPRIKIIIVTAMPEHSFIQKAKAIGCESFWYKDVGNLDLLSVMERTIEGESIYPETSPVLDIGIAKSIDFTPRELEVLREKINGYSNQEICNRLGIKKSTLDYHIKNILSKSGYSNVLRLSMDVVEQKFIIPDF
ncbi:MAG: response regulator [Anaerovoracaceae bacterium]|jgi:DNA-binding NarL/FixJ family response regulator